jgi:flavodoxin
MESPVEALVVYDSVFGNTRLIAQSIADALASRVSVELLLAADADPDKLTRCELLVVGSPTRGFRPTEAITALLKRLAKEALRGAKVAAFDTRLKADEIDSAGLRFVVKTGGYAAKRIGGQLKRAGAEMVVPPEGFYVVGTEGPLKEGERERAAAWALEILDSR